MFFDFLQFSPLISAITAAVICFTAHYLLNVAKKPKLISAEGKFKQFIVENVPAVSETYWPTFWCFYSHMLMTVSMAFRDRIPEHHFYRELISTPDGGTLSLDWYDPKSLGASLPLSFSFPICLFIPGLTGTSRAEYLRLLISLAHSTGYRAVVLNHRGLAGTPLTSSRFYCAATHADLEFALRHIRKLNPTVRLVASGLSMGGTILAGYLVGAGTHSLIDAAFLISTCWDLKKGAQQLRRGFWSARFNKYLTRLIVTAVLKHREVFLKGGYNFDFDSFTSFTSLHQFDGAFTIKMFGFPSTDAYYKAASFSDRVNEIKVPTLCLNSADDMLAPEADLPLKQVQSCDHVAMVVTARGGHLGFMESALMPSLEPTFYLERLFGQYIKALFEMKETPRSLAN